MQMSPAAIQTKQMLGEAELIAKQHFNSTSENTIVALLQAIAMAGLQNEIKLAAKTQAKP